MVLRGGQKGGHYGHVESIGARIRALRRARDWTQQRLAEQVNAVSGRATVTADEVKRWERDKRTPWPETRGFIAAALGVPVEALDAALPDPIRRAHEWLVADTPQQIARAAGRRVGADLAERVETRVVELRLLDDHVGGDDLAPAVERELRHTNRILGEASYAEPVGRRLLTASGELAQLAGWTASDAGRFDAAHRLYVGGVDAAEAAGDTALAANLLSSLSYQLANTGAERDALLLARTAAKGATDAAGTVRALLAERVAWAAARCGEEDAARRALDAVDDAFDDGGNEDPEWTYWLSRDEIDTMAARVHIQLGRPVEAAALLEPVLSRYPVSSARESALYWAELAEAHARACDIDAARQSLGTARGFAERVNSARAGARVAAVEALIGA